MRYEYAHPHPAVTTDIVVFTVDNGELRLLLIKRNLEPFRGQWALPGGFVRLDESLDACASRELAEETGLQNVYLEQLYTFGAPDRDPRERVISIAYYALMPLGDKKVQADTDAAIAQWFDFKSIPDLAFDHEDIIKLAYERLCAKMDYSTIGLQFMPDEFTLSDVQSLYETVSGQQRDKRNFRKWLLGLDLLEETGTKRSEGAYRPAMLYRLKKKDDVALLK